jgi:hypothetical protein
LSNVIDARKFHTERDDITEAWKLYENGKNYNNRLEPNQYDLVNTNIEFFIGNQWINLPMSNAMSQLPRPVFNIIKRIGALFVASLCSAATKVNYESLQNKDGNNLQDQSSNAASMATAEVENLFDKFKMDFRIREALTDGVQTGDYCAHFYWDPTKIPYGGAYGAYRGEIQMELVDGINIMFGNPNSYIVEDQPYILVIGRDIVDTLKNEYLTHHKKGVDESGSIQSDSETQWQAASGGKVELIEGDDYGKALYVYLYTKRSKEVNMKNPDGSDMLEMVTDKSGNPVIDKTKEGFPIYDAMGQPVYKTRPVKETQTTVYVSKHTRNVTIYEEIDTELSCYPIAWGNWERQKNQYHGRALVTGIIPNQIYINSMFALVMRHQQMLGFPKILFNGDYISHWDNTVGQAIAIRNIPDGIPLQNAYAVIQPADMSTQIMQCIDMAMMYTKECLGATDAQLGSANPDNTSALIALQSASQVPLENPQACKYEWIEDIGRILLDFMGTYYGERPVVRTRDKQIQSQKPVINPNNGMPVSDPETGAPMMEQALTTQKEKAIEMFDFSQLKHLWMNVRADVGASTYWSRVAIVQTLDNLKRDGVLDVIDYLERMPEEYIPLKDDLLNKYKQIQMDQGQAPQPMQPGGAPSMGAEEGIGTLPTATQANLQNMTTRSQNVILKNATGGV